MHRPRAPPGVALRGGQRAALGVIGTKLLREGFGMSGGSVESGSATTLRVATDPALARVTGRYFSDQREVPAARDRAAQERLYTVSAGLTGVEPLPLPAE